jgi:hypothetical protein
MERYVGSPSSTLAMPCRCKAELRRSPRPYLAVQSRRKRVRALRLLQLANVVVLRRQLAAELDGVFALDPGDVVLELMRRQVLVHTIVAIPAAVIEERPIGADRRASRVGPNGFGKPSCWPTERRWRDVPDALRRAMVENCISLNSVGVQLRFQRGEHRVNLGVGEAAAAGVCLTDFRIPEAPAELLVVKWVRVNRPDSCL